MTRRTERQSAWLALGNGAEVRVTLGADGTLLAEEWRPAGRKPKDRRRAPR